MGDTEAVTNAQTAMEETVTREVVENIVKAYDADQELVDFTSVAGTQAGDNFMSVMYAVDIEMKSRKTGETTTLPIMLKTMPRNETRQKMINDMAVFDKELLMYSEILPEMERFQKEKGITDEDLFKHYPKVYATFQDRKSDYIAMENLRTRRFEMQRKSKGCDMEHAKTTLKNLAKFHAISFAMFDGDYDKLKAKYPILQEKLYMPAKDMPEDMKNMYKTSLTTGAEIMEEKGLKNEASSVNELANMDKLFDYMYQRVDNRNSKWVALNHGDCWINNMMFAHDEHGKLVDFKFVDFQILRTCSVVTDVCHFLYSSIEEELMATKMIELVQFYYEEFIDFATKLGVDTEAKQLTWENFREEFEDHRLYGLVLAIMFSTILAADSKDIPDMEEMKEEDFQGEKLKEFFAKIVKETGAKRVVNIAINLMPEVRQLKDLSNIA